MGFVPITISAGQNPLVHRNFFSDLQNEIRLVPPLLLASTGEPLALPSPAWLGDLVAAILDEVFIRPADWVAVQASIASLASLQPQECTARILNYGQGVGMSQTAATPPPPSKTLTALTFFTAKTEPNPAQLPTSGWVYLEITNN
ncbi:hypothetical protein VTG60DRAFT_2033 [Thermothelomyces hinnuleus]